MSYIDLLWHPVVGWNLESCRGLSADMAAIFNNKPWFQNANFKGRMHCL